MRPSRLTLLVLTLVLAMPAYAAQAERPRLFLSAEDVELINATEPQPSSFSVAVERARARVGRYLDEIPDVPLPVDPGGGYTHEQHKRNASTIQDAGILYQLTGNTAYAELARDILLAYAKMYPGLGEHPQKKNQAPGKLFWQSLNEAVWLVTSIQGYDAIYTALTEKDRSLIENGVLRPMVSFLSVESPQTFDKIHNHGTWAVTAVGMTGYVLGDREYVDRALYGLAKDGSAGFMKQLDLLFSPDGYYSEGPYYQRYAMMPFLLFAKSIQRNEPDRKIFEYRDGVLLKAVNTTIQLSYGGYFFPINDALKDKGLDTLELCYGVAIAYGLTGDPGLLSIAEFQNRIVLTGDGFRLAQALDAELAEPFAFSSLQLLDGPDGDQGAISILRSSSETGGQALVFKATGQGMGHGHFDKLAWLFYDNGHEVVSDYGAARFLNVEEKAGGRYLPENNTWAKQTIAHNTLVVDETSHFDGDWKRGEKVHPVPLVFESGQKIDLTAALMNGANDDVSFTRVMGLLKDDLFPEPVVIDVLKVKSSGTHQYDLPLYYQGHITSVSHPLEASTKTLSALGESNGYQHLWLRAKANVAEGELFQVTWLNDNRFYTYSVLADAAMEVLFTQIGADDPDFNLRTEPGLVLRVAGASDHTFVSVLEPHGEYNGSREFTTASASHLLELDRETSGEVEFVRVVNSKSESRLLALSYDNNPDKTHSIKSGDALFEWTGFFRLFDD